MKSNRVRTLKDADWQFSFLLQERLFVMYLHCCHGEMAQCSAQPRWHWRENHSRMSFHWSAGCTMARTLLREANASRLKKMDVRAALNISLHSHHSHTGLFAVGSCGTLQRWKFFPPHTGIPIQLCGRPDLKPIERRDSGKQNRTKTTKIKEWKLSKVEMPQCCYQLLAWKWFK